jgi:hypothetical protein
VLIALVLAVGPMLKVTPASTVVPAPAKVRVEGLQHLWAKPADGLRADVGTDVFARLADIVPLGARVDIESNVEVTVEQLVQRRRGPGGLAFVNLVEQARAHLLGVAAGGSAGRDGLGEVVRSTVTGSTPA